MGCRGAIAGFLPHERRHVQRTATVHKRRNRWHYAVLGSLDFSAKMGLASQKEISEWLFEVETMHYGAVASVGVGEAWEWGKGRLR